MTLTIDGQAEVTLREAFVICGEDWDPQHLAVCLALAQDGFTASQIATIFDVLFDVDVTPTKVS